MNGHNKHNENTADKRQADASQLSEEQQALLTAEALGQLDAGSADAAKAAEICSGQHRSEADELAADTTKVADALQSALLHKKLLHLLMTQHEKRCDRQC